MFQYFMEEDIVKNITIHLVKSLFDVEYNNYAFSVFLFHLSNGSLAIREALVPTWLFLLGGFATIS